MLSLKTALAIILVPGTACLLVPYFILTATRTSFDQAIGIPQILAFLIAALGLYLILWVGVAFVRQGKGTPIPIEPPTHLVINGLYGHMRNPMYAGAILIVIAEALYFASVYLLLYAAGLWAVLHTSLVVYEEPQLKRRFGREYEQYLTEVPRWIPRLGRYRLAEE